MNTEIIVSFASRIKIQNVQFLHSHLDLFSSNVSAMKDEKEKGYIKLQEQ